MEINKEEADEILSWAGWFISESTTQLDYDLVRRIFTYYPELESKYSYLLR